MESDSDSDVVITGVDSPISPTFKIEDTGRTSLPADVEIMGPTMIKLDMSCTDETEEVKIIRVEPKQKRTVQTVHVKQLLTRKRQREPHQRSFYSSKAHLKQHLCAVSSQYTVSMGNKKCSKRSKYINVTEADSKPSTLITSKTAKLAREIGPQVRKGPTTELMLEQLLESRCKVDMKLVPFKDVTEEDYIGWITASNQVGSPKEQPVGRQNCMLSQSRNLCGFVHFGVDPKNHLSHRYYCNYCKITEKNLEMYTKHIHHHLFVCGMCAYHSANRLDLEIHRQRTGHTNSDSKGYLVHQQHSLDDLVPMPQNSKPAASLLLVWRPIKEKTESLIIMDSDFISQSMISAFQKASKSTGEKNMELNSVSIVCAMPYYRYIPAKVVRQHVLELHCNFCQSTPAFTQELYRHIDFHLFPCNVTNCSFKAFTLLEKYFHLRKVHADTFEEFMGKLYLIVPDMVTDVGTNHTEREFDVHNSKWVVSIDLPQKRVMQVANALFG